MTILALSLFEHFAADRVGFADFESVSADSAGLRFCALKD